MSWSISSVVWPRSARPRRRRPSSSLSRASSPAAGSSRHKQARISGQRAGDADQLAGALGELIGHRVGRPAEVDQLEDLLRVCVGAVRAVGGPSAQRPGGGDSDVLADLEVVEQVGVLPCPGQPAAGSLIRRQRTDVLRVELDPPGERHEAR